MQKQMHLQRLHLQKIIAQANNLIKIKVVLEVARTTFTFFS